MRSCHLLLKALPWFPMVHLRRNTEFLTWSISPREFQSPFGLTLLSFLEHTHSCFAVVSFWPSHSGLSSYFRIQRSHHCPLVSPHHLSQALICFYAILDFIWNFMYLILIVQVSAYFLVPLGWASFAIAVSLLKGQEAIILFTLVCSSLIIIACA